MEKIKFAIIGCGRISYRHIEAITANPDAELVALCDLNMKRAKERNVGVGVKIFQDYREMLEKEEIDVVNIMTPSGMHAEHAVDIIKRYQKHIVLEKPMCLNINDGEVLIETARRSGVQLFVVHQNRFNKAVQKLKSEIDKDCFGRFVLGTVRLRWARGGNYYSRDPWRGTWALDGGALTNQAIHHIDLLRWLMGDAVSVSAISASRLINMEVEDVACAWLRFREGALGIIEATTAVRPLDKDLEASVSILSERGVAIVEGASVNKLTTWTLGDIDLSEYYENPPNVYGFGHNQIINNVVETLNGKNLPLVTAEDALVTIKLLSAIYRSIELDGREVHLADKPVSERLGKFDAKGEKIADLYRTDVVLGERRWQR